MLSKKEKKQLQKLQEQKTAPKKQGSFFRKLLGFLLFIAWIVILAEPVYRPDKPTADLYIFRFGRKVGEVVTWVDGRLDAHIPKPYYTQVKDVARPYGTLASDIGKILFNMFDDIRAAFKGFVNEKYPIVVAQIDNYAPGLIDNARTVFKDTFSNTVYYYQRSVNYLQKEVFVGQLSPENIQRVVVGAYNTTSGKAIEYYHWVYQKVQTSIK